MRNTLETQQSIPKLVPEQPRESTPRFKHEFDGGGTHDPLPQHAQRPSTQQLHGPQGQENRLIKERAQYIEDVRALATPASVRLLNKKLRAFDRKCEDIELAIDHLCTIVPEKQDKLLAELTAMTTEKIETDSEICQVYTASQPETQNILEPIKLSLNKAKDNKVKIRSDLNPTYSARIAPQ